MPEPAKKTYLGTSNFGNTKVNGTLEVTGKASALQEGTVGAGSHDLVTGNQLHNAKTELTNNINSAKTELNKKITDMDTAYKAADTALQGKIDGVKSEFNGKRITVAANSGAGYTITGAQGGLKFVGGNNIDTTADASGNVNIALKNDVTLSSLTVNGNLAVNGTTTTVNSADLTVKDNMITLNSGETGEGVSKGTAGIEIARGTQKKFQLVFDEADDKLKAGIEGTLKAVATEEFVKNEIKNATSAGSQQLVNGQWKVTVQDDSLVIMYGDQLLASWDKPVADKP